MGIWISKDKSFFGSFNNGDFYDGIGYEEHSRDGYFDLALKSAGTVNEEAPLFPFEEKQGSFISCSVLN